MNAPPSLHVPPDQRQWVGEVLGGEYEPHVNFNDPPVVIDCGANCGQFLAWVTQRYRCAKVICYEPMPHNLVYLARNAATRQDIVEIVPLAVTSQAPEKVRLYEGKENCGQCSLHDLGGQKLNTGFWANTIHPFDLPPCDLLKIDTEGCELDILWFYPHDPKVIVLEYHRDSDAEAITKLLTKRSYYKREQRSKQPNLGIQIYWKVVPRDSVPATTPPTAPTP